MYDCFNSIMNAKDDIIAICFDFLLGRQFFSSVCTADYSNLGSNTSNLFHSDPAAYSERTAPDVQYPDDIGKGNSIPAACGSLDFTHTGPN